MRKKSPLCSNYRFTRLKKTFNGKYTVCISPSDDRNWSYRKKIIIHFIDRAIIATFLSSLTQNTIVQNMGDISDSLCIGRVLILWFSLVGLGCRIHRLHLCRELRLLTSNECPGYDIELSDYKGSAQEIWEMWSTPRSTLTRIGSTW